MSSGPGLLCAERRSVGVVACLLSILRAFAVTLSPYTLSHITYCFLICYILSLYADSFPLYITSFFPAIFLFYGRISPFIPLIPFYLSNPPIIPPSFPFSPFPPVSPFAAVSSGFSVLFGLFRWSWSGPGGAGSAVCYTCLLAAVPASVRASSAALLVLLGGPGAVLPGLPPSALVRCPSVRFSVLVFFARAGRGGSAAERTKSGAAALVRRRRSWACIPFSGPPFISLPPGQG